jgi:stage V sporulation protein G
MDPIVVTCVSVKNFTCADPRLKAFASIVLNDDFAVKELKIIERSDGPFVAMPNCRGRDGLFHDLAHPIDQTTRDLVHKAVLDAYHQHTLNGARSWSAFKPPSPAPQCQPAGIVVTHIAVRPHTNSDPRLRGFATIILNDAFIVKDIKIIHGSTGWFAAMPSRKRRDGRFYDVAHPLRRSVRQRIEEQILSAYKAETAGGHIRQLDEFIG